MIPNSSPSREDQLHKIGSVLEEDYKEALNAHIRYEVQTGKRSKAALEEFEAALSHLSLSFRDKTKFDFHLAETKKHLGRISVEMTEEVAEDLLRRIRCRVDPFIKHPFLVKICWISPLSHGDKIFKDIKKVMNLVEEGRRLKGNHSNPMNALSVFKEAFYLAEDLDINTSNILLGRIWNFLLALAFCLVGFLFNICIS